MISDILNHTFTSLVENKNELLRLLAIPLVASISLSVVSELDVSSFVIMTVNILEILVYTVIAVTTHRIVLLGRESIPGSILKWSMRETRFTLYGIAIGLVTIPCAILVFIPYVGIPAFLILLLYLCARLSLIFPGTAVDHKISFQDSWDMTKNYQLIMVSVIFIFPLIIIIPELLLENIKFYVFFSGIYNAFSTVILVALLSITYKLIYDDLSKS